LEKEKISEYFCDNGEDPLVVYIDGAATAQRLIHLINQDAEFSTVLEGLAQSIDTDDVRELRREITGRRYTQITTYEIDDYNGLPAFPYFKVTVGNTSYGSEEMGLGELCANYILWALGRCREGTLLLLEEPESHLPPRAQERLMTYIVSLLTEKDLNVVLSTHSQHTLANIPPTHITFLGRLDDKSVIQNNPKITTLYESLRIAPTKLSILVVEDHSAFAFLEEIIAKIDASLLGRVDFTWKSGWSDIDDILLKVPKQNPGKIGFLGVYDGDQRTSKRPTLQWSHLYLPGNKDPAEYMVEEVRKKTQEFAKIIGHETLGMEIAVANLETVDVKDFFIQLQKSTGEKIQNLYQASTELWLSDSSNKRDATLFVSELRKLAFR
jgi:hypothetical protein